VTARGSRDPVWERPEPPSRPAPSPLSRDAIVRAAIDLADNDGLDAVSIRKVADALGAGPMRLYGYLSTKEELLDLMVDEVHGEIPLATGGDWREALKGTAHGTREAALRHQWFAGLLGGRPHLGPNALAQGEASLAALADRPGFERIDAVSRAIGTVNAYVVGAIRREVGQDVRRWQAESAAYLGRMLDTGRYPTLARFVRDATHDDPRVAFDAGLDLVLNGIGGPLDPGLHPVVLVEQRDQ
jgi:AcrR family transcriptional regulator